MKEYAVKDYGTRKELYFEIKLNREDGRAIE